MLLATELVAEVTRLKELVEVESLLELVRVILVTFVIESDVAYVFDNDPPVESHLKNKFIKLENQQISTTYFVVSSFLPR